MAEGVRVLGASVSQRRCACPRTEQLRHPPHTIHRRAVIGRRIRCSRVVRTTAYFLAPAFGAAAFAPFCFFVFAVFFGLLSPIVVLLFPANIRCRCDIVAQIGGAAQVRRHISLGRSFRPRIDADGLWYRGGNRTVWRGLANEIRSRIE